MNLSKRYSKLHLKYKKEHNPLEKTIKLLLNSIYNKSILKPMTDEVKVVEKKKLIAHLYRNYNFIKEVVLTESPKAYVKQIKPINDHYNLPQFGASVLSWRKHIMNRVMSTAEQNGIDTHLVKYKNLFTIATSSRALPFLGSNT